MWPASHILVKGINDTIRNSQHLLNRLSIMKSQANQAISKAVIESGTSKNINTIASVGRNRGYRFNNRD